MESYVVNGELAHIEDFPYSVYISIRCEKTSFLCGGSIINQNLILTAAHCLYLCGNGKVVQNITVSLGSSHKQRGLKTAITSYVVHEHYDDYKHDNDLALLKMKKKVTLNSKISRVAVMQNPPNIIKVGQVAGWGVIDDKKVTYTQYLMKLSQEVWDKKECEKYYGILFAGQFCASSKHHSQSQYVSVGDSGSALVIQGYIQIGLVSFKIPTISKSLIVYTNISYYHKWITLNARRLYCH